MKTYGLDISKHNGTLDFKKIKEAGHTFVIIRVGYGVSGTIDPKFNEYYKGAKAAGLHIGFYWYSYALSTADGLKEAQYCYNAIKDKEFDYPVYIDMEDADGYKKKHGMPKDSTLCSICETFCKYMEDKGLYAGIYANKDWFNNKLKGVSSKYDKWFAQYGTNNGKQQQEYDGKYPIHQYTSTYKLSGKSFDKNACYVDYPSITKKVSGTAQKLLSKADELAGIIVADKNWTYYNTGDKRTWADARAQKPHPHTNCAHYVCMVLQEAGLISKGLALYSGTDGKLVCKDNKDSQINNELNKSFSMIDMKGANADSASLKPGDICMYDYHMNIFVKKEGGYAYWYDFGRGGVSDGKENSGYFTRKIAKRDSYATKVFKVLRPKEATQTKQEESKVSIIIGSARIDERGKVSGGKAGDQKQTSSTNDTKGEVSMQTFYVHSKGWYVLRPKDSKHAVAIASNMVTACNNVNLGYDQSNRDGVIKYGVHTKTKTECDCSSLVRACVKEATGKDPGNFNTESEVSKLTGSGLFEPKKVYTSDMKLYTGDVLVTKSKGHTVIVTSGYSRDEYNSAKPATTTSSTKLNKSIKYNVNVNTTALNVRTWAGKTNKLCSFGPLKKGTTVGVCDSVKDANGVIWYYICYKGKYGFIHSGYVKR